MNGRNRIDTRIGSRRIAAWAAGISVAFSFAGCGGRMPTELAKEGQRFAPCPSSPNCVSSDATDALHAIEPLRLRGEPGAAWTALVAHLASLERVEIVRKHDDYVYAVFTTRLMRYRDDVEFELDRERGVVRVRSASRVGYGDMGVNRERIESIRSVLAEQGFVEVRRAQ